MTSYKIFAWTDITLTTPYEEISSVPLELKDLAADSVFIEGAKIPSYFQSDMLLRIPLVDPIGTGDTVTVRVYYSGFPYHEAWGGFHYSSNYAFNLGVGLSEIPHNLGKAWFPCVDNFTDRAIYDVHATVDNAMTMIAAGLLVDIVPSGNGKHTFHWHCGYTLPPYLVSIAIGDYAHVSDTFQGLDGDVPIDFYVRPSDSLKVAGTYTNLKDILDIFEDCMGPYPFERVGYTGTAIGAMEHATSIFVPHFTISGNTGNEALMAHELSHMWVGDMVTCNSAEEMWLNEGWASFFQYYYALRLYDDPETFRTDMRATHASVLQNCHTSSGDGSYFPLNQIPQDKTYGMAAYDKGATVVQSMRFYLGDSLFFETLKAYLEEYAYQPASSYDMRNFMTGHTGIDMTGFFDNWVMHSGTPHYSIDSFRVIPAGDAYKVIIDARQKRKGPAFKGDGNFVEVMYMDQDWNQYTDTIHFDGETGHSVRISLFEPSIILVDPEEKMMDATTDNYKAIKATGNYNFEKTFFNLQVDGISDSAFIQVTHNWVPPDSLKLPLEGLRISDYRYWRIEGIFPATFEATGKFYYTRNGYLDNTLITSEEDSIIILYRKNCSEDWQSVPFSQVGNWTIGNLLVPDLRPGEYTLAVWNPHVGVPEEENPKHGSLKIYPNPSSNSFSILSGYNGKAKISIYSSNGSEVDTFFLQKGPEEVTWSPDKLPSGHYTVCLYSGNDLLLDRQKAIYMR
jgi:aminopeptidase N